MYCFCYSENVHIHHVFPSPMLVERSPDSSGLVMIELRVPGSKSTPDTCGLNRIFRVLLPSYREGRD